MSEHLSVSCSYCSLSSAYSPGVDADYTTWKIREDGEHKQTLDYIFYSAGALDCEAVLKAKRPIWGHASSAVVRGDLVYFHIGARPGGTLIALEKKTGKLRWKALTDRPGYSTLLPVSMHGKPQLLAFTADNLASVAPDTGKLIYKTPFKTSNYDVAIISPVVMGNSVLVSGYWDGSALFKIDDKLQPKTAWTTHAMRTAKNSI